MSRRLAVALAAAVSLALALTGCTGSAPAASSGPRATLTVGAVVEPTTLDAFSNNAAAIPQVLLYNVYETLVKVDEEGVLKPGLATSWETSADRKVYTFHLAEGHRFASGNPVTAADVVASFDRVRKNTANKVQSGQMAVIASIAAPDPRTVQVTLSQPSNMWLWNITSTPGMVVDSQAPADLSHATAGSGPYRLKEWRRGQQITLERNPFFGGEKPAFENVTFRYFTDPTAMNNAMASGDLDVISNVQAPQAIDQFKDASRYTTIEGTTNGEVVMGMNHATPALANLQVRQAILHAIDRKALVDTVWNGKGMLIGSMVAPTDPWFVDHAGDYAYDPAKAKQLLASSGLAGPIRLRLRVPNLAYATSAAQFVVSSLKEVGIEVSVDTLEFPARWLDLVYAKGDYDMTIIAHLEPRDLGNWGRPDYYWHYDSAAFRALLAQADAGTPEVQKAKLAEAAALLSKDAAADFLFLMPNLVVTKADVTGVSKNLTTLSFDVSPIRIR